MTLPPYFLVFRSLDLTWTTATGHHPIPERGQHLEVSESDQDPQRLFEVVRVTPRWSTGPGSRCRMFTVDLREVDPG